MNKVTQLNITTIIYVLVDPRDGSIFYVGRTIVGLSKRIQGHLKDARKKRTQKGKYIALMLESGIRPEIRAIEILQNATKSEAITKEKAWQQFYAITCTLANTGGAELGGHGTNGRIPWTPETLAMLGKYPDEEIALKMKCDRKSVEYQRDKWGIPRCPQTNFVIPPMGGWNKIPLPDNIIEQMGKMSDNEVAKLAGVSKTVIRKRRISLGIDCYAVSTGNNGRWGERVKERIFVSPPCQICESTNTIRYGSKFPNPQYHCKDCLSRFTIGVGRFKSPHPCIFCDSTEVYRATRSGKNKNLIKCDRCLKSFKIDDSKSQTLK